MAAPADGDGEAKEVNPLADPSIQRAAEAKLEAAPTGAVEAHVDAAADGLLGAEVELFQFPLGRSWPPSTRLGFGRWKRYFWLGLAKTDATSPGATPRIRTRSSSRK